MTERESSSYMYTHTYIAAAVVISFHQHYACLYIHTYVFMYNNEQQVTTYTHAYIQTYIDLDAQTERVDCVTVARWFMSSNPI